MFRRRRQKARLSPDQMQVLMPDRASFESLSAQRTERPSQPDAFGQAALLLAESTLHALVEARVLTCEQAVEAVRTAVEVKAELTEDVDDAPDLSRRSLALLERIEQSMATMGGTAT